MLKDQVERRSCVRHRQLRLRGPWLMAYSPLAVWLIAQVTVTELILATATLETECRRHGWNVGLSGAGIALLKFVFFEVCLFGVSRHAPQADVPTNAILRLLLAGMYFLNKSYILFNAERNIPAPQPFAPRMRAFRIIRVAFAHGVWSLMADCGGIHAALIAISNTLGRQRALLGAVPGIDAIIFIMFKTEQMDFAKIMKSSSSGFGAGIVAGYAVHFSDPNSISRLKVIPISDAWSYLMFSS